MDHDTAEDIKFRFICDCSEFEIKNTLRIYCDRHPELADWLNHYAWDESAGLYGHPPKPDDFRYSERYPHL